MLQICVVVAGFVPVIAGALGVLDVGSILAGSGQPVGVISQERYLSGLLLAIGLAFWFMVADIERHTVQIRLLTGLVVMGGLCRLAGVALGDSLSPAVEVPLLMELVVTPLLCLWQNRLAERYRY